MKRKDFLLLLLRCVDFFLSPFLPQLIFFISTKRSTCSEIKKIFLVNKHSESFVCVLSVCVWQQYEGEYKKSSLTNTSLCRERAVCSTLCVKKMCIPFALFREFFSSLSFSSLFTFFFFGCAFFSSINFHFYYYNSLALFFVSFFFTQCSCCCLMLFSFFFFSFNLLPPASFSLLSHSSPVGVCRKNY